MLNCSPVEVDGINDVAFIIGTSGTTGPFKSIILNPFPSRWLKLIYFLFLSSGVCLSHASLACAFDTINTRMYANGIVRNASSLYCISAPFTLLVGTVCGATRIITTQKSSFEMDVRIIKDYRVTIVETEPAYLLDHLKIGSLSKSDLSSIKYMIVGESKTIFQEQYNSYLVNGSVISAYGLTEIGDVSIDFPSGSRENTAGHLVSGLTVKVIDEQGHRCGVNVDGEICVKSRFKFLGYYKNEKLTKEAVDSEGFFLTGDIGHLDEEGYLYITDRKKNVIPTCDIWLFPSEIEDILLKSNEIKNVCVVGVSCDSFYETPAAIVVRADGASITEADIHKLIGGKFEVNGQSNSQTLNLLNFIT